jgi:hypothetical protein
MEPGGKERGARFKRFVVSLTSPSPISGDEIVLASVDKMLEGIWKT